MPPTESAAAPAYWEALEVGVGERSPGRTITEADIVAFAGVSGDWNPLHTDADYARERTLAGERVAHGLLGLSVASGLFTRTALGTAIQEQVLAMLSLEWDFVGMIRIGDSVRLEFEVESRRETSRPDRGIVILARRLVRADGEVLQRGRTTLMVARDPS